MSNADASTARLDVWLWRARFFKTRALASTQIGKRGVRITRHGQTRRVNKPGASVMAGDVLTFARGRNIECLEILAVGERRGPASEAQMLYQSTGDDDV